MSAYVRNAPRTPEQVLGSAHYRVHELDIDRLWQAHHAMDLLALLDNAQPSPITLDHVAAVAAYAAADLRQVLENACGPDRGTEQELI